MTEVVSSGRKHKYFLQVILVSFIFILTALQVAAQGGFIVAGTVSDKQGVPLQGVNVTVNGTVIGVVSDADGKYSINVPNVDAVLVFSFTGYLTQEIIVNDQTEINITLPEDVNSLNEIVIVGYGTQKRKELTGAVSTVSKSVLEHPALSFDGMLGGAVAGVSVAQISGQPGASSSIRIRGGNSVHAGNEPLYVIDGFIFYSDNSSTQTGLGNIEGSLNPLAAINPVDIESIEILKDVSATAIYGSRGANGVIIVTTKKGNRGKNTVNYQYTFGVERVSKKLKLMNGAQWAQIQNEYEYNYFDDATIASLGEGYDWQEEIFRTAHVQNHEVSVNGGDDRTRYLISGSYVNQDGILINTGFKRYNARVNIDRSLFSNFTVGVNATGGKSEQNSVTAVEANNATYQGRITNSLGYALRMPPVVPIYDGNGYNYHNPYEKSNDMTNPADGSQPNPIADMNNSVGQNINSSLLGNFYAQYTILPGLTAKASAGINFSNTTQNIFSPSTSVVGLLLKGYGGIGSKRYESWQQEYTLNYSKQFGKAHFLDALAGYTTQNTSVRYVTAATAKFSNETLTFNNLYDGNNPDFPRSGGSDTWLNSALGRINYTLLGRYNLTATIRADESSRLAPGHRWGFFPSVGVSWNITEEDFLKSIRTLNNAKLRLTYGTVGNQEIGDNLYASTYVAGKSGEGNETITVYRKSRLGNPDLTWETTVQYNIGIDVGLWKNRLTIVADAYYKETSDLLYNAPLDVSTGFSSQMKNLGNVVNKGVEFSAQATVAESKNLLWTVTANISRNINKVTDLGGVDRVMTGSGIGLSTSNEIILAPGEALNSFYGLVFDGVVQTGEDVSKLPRLSWKAGDPVPGDPKFVDITPDGVIDDKDRTVIGSVQPDFIYGLSSSASFRGFDLFISFQGSYGGKVYNRLRRELETPNTSYNMSAVLLDRWTEENPSNTIPRISQEVRFNYLDDRFVEDASYLRLKNITLGYTLPGKIKTLPFKFRIFATAQNLLTVTGYKGYDPEVASGIDYGVYPTARTFSAGVRITF
ncbi:MAG: TonB-dependent receptor [Prevotellaceae bacterium]|jgi:TonB-linked SusC/RagA family outer membrane protein|nr:TonB-dependent receptor [Prevotellaceae bacterium]